MADVGAAMKMLRSYCTCGSLCPCVGGGGNDLSDDETQAVNVRPFEIPPRRRSDYQGIEDQFEETSLNRSRSASAASSTRIQLELYDDLCGDSDDFTLYGPPSLEDRVRREDVEASYGTLTFATKVHANKKISLRLYDVRGLPSKGPGRSRTYWVAARATLRKCTKKCRAVRVNEHGPNTRLNEDLRFLGSAGDQLQITVFEEGTKERPLNQADVLGYCEVAVETATSEADSDNDALEKLYTCRLTQALVTTPMGQLLLSLHYEDSKLLTVAVVKTKGLPEAPVKVTLRCNGEKVKKGRVKGLGPIYNQSFKFILPEHFLANSSVLISLTANSSGGVVGGEDVDNKNAGGGQSQGSSNGPGGVSNSRRLRKAYGQRRPACCISGPWMIFADGRLTHWGEMLILKKPVLQWRQLYPM